MKAALYLIPVTLGDTLHDKVFPSYNIKVIEQIKYFIVENVREARRFLRKASSSIVIDDLTFYELNKHTLATEVSAYLKPLENGESMGVISDAGCPGIADPGADVVMIAQEKGLKVVPLIGPSSITLSIMSSGFNGQSFAFNGYLPIKAPERLKMIKKMEERIYKEAQTQLFIETPYRNDKLLSELLTYCQPMTKLCIACNVTCDDEYIRTLTIKKWKKQKLEIGKRPTIFLLYK